MRDFETLNDSSCVKCHLQRSNAIRRPKRNRKIYGNHTKKQNVYIAIVNQEKERLLIVETAKSDEDKTHRVIKKNT